MLPIADRFWTKVKKTSSCWPWTAALNPSGYGMLSGGRKKDAPLRAHRISWIIHMGQIPNGMHVLHRCDNRRCVNPSHLFLGSNLDNVRDMVKKERNAKGVKHSETMKRFAARGDKNGTKTHPEKILKGESHFAAILTNGKIIQIRSMRRAGLKLKHIGDIFGVAKSTICCICKRRRWKHVA